MLQFCNTVQVALEETLKPAGGTESVTRKAAGCK